MEKEINKHTSQSTENEVSQDQNFEKAASLSELGQAFTEPSEAELTQEEYIARSSEVTEEEKEALIKTLKKVETKAKKYDASNMRRYKQK